MMNYSSNFIFMILKFYNQNSISSIHNSLEENISLNQQKQGGVVDIPVMLPSRGILTAWRNGVTGTS